MKVFKYLKDNVVAGRFPCGSAAKEPPANAEEARDKGSIPGGEDPLED